MLIFDFKTEPKVWNGFVNYKHSSEDVLITDGFFDLTKVPYNENTEKLAEYIFDTVNHTCTQISTPLSDVELEIIRVKSIPLTVKNMDFRLALIKSGVSISSVDAFIATIENEVFKEQVSTLWNFATLFERKDSILIQMAASLGITSLQLDELFIKSK